MSSDRASLVLAAIVMAVATIAGGTEPEILSLAPERTALTLEHSESGDELLVATLSEVRLGSVEIDGQRWLVVEAPGATNLMSRSLPSLPFLATEYVLGERDGIKLELIQRDVQVVDLALRGLAGVAPSKGHFDRNTDPATVPFTFDSRVYHEGQPFPTDDTWLDQPFIAGPLRGQALRVPLARWLPKENRLELVERAVFRVVHEEEAVNPRRRPQPPMTGLFEQSARRRAVNFEHVADRSAGLVESGRLLILAYDDFVDEVQPLADWETLVGYPTLLVSTSDAGVTTAADVQQYIQALYDDPQGLTFIILVGDAQQIPDLAGVFEGKPCDPCYTKLEGDDQRPDAAISRLSGSTGAQIAAQVSKIVAYERYPATGAGWYETAFGVASDQSEDGSLTDWQRMEQESASLLGASFTEFGRLYDSHFPWPSGTANPTADDVAVKVNAGAALGLYIGHGWSGGWGTSNFATANVHQLSNASMLPVIWSVACNNGQFYNVDECFAEAWLREQSGGAVSFEGATTSEDWVPPCVAQAEIVADVVDGVAFTTGGQHVNGKLKVFDTYGDGADSAATMFMEQSHLFGAATLWPRSAPPAVPDEPTDYVLNGGIASLTVTVGGQPLAQADAAIVSFYTTDGSSISLLGSGLVDQDGVVHAAVSAAPTHCHIHGLNLVPTEYEVVARPVVEMLFDDGFEGGDCSRWSAEVSPG